MHGLNMWNRVRKLRNDPTFKYGVPMLLLIVGGSFGLREFTQIRYDAKQSQIKVDPEIVARLKSMDHDKIIQEEYKKLKDMDLDGWKNIRGPRPWEE